MKIAICPGSFDPVTKGHLDIILRASKLFDKVIVVASTNPKKNNTFSLEKRCELIKKAVGDNPKIEVQGCDGLLAEYAKEVNANVIVKGLRAMSDFEYEFQMALTNKKLNPELETVFLTSSAENMYMSSSMVRQVSQFGGDISAFVPKEILSDVEEVLNKINNKEDK